MPKPNFTIKEEVDNLKVCCDTTNESMIPMLEAMNEVVSNLNLGQRGSYTLNQDNPDDPNKNGWNFIAINVKGVNVKEYFIDRLNNKYGVEGGDIIEVCNAFVGHTQDYINFIPSIVNPKSANFSLIVTDGESWEIQPFFAKVKNCSHISDTIVFDWNSSDGNSGV